MNKDKELLRAEIVIGVLSMIILFGSVAITLTVPMTELEQTIVVSIGTIVCFIGAFYSLRLEQIAGFYQCKHCNHKHIPTYKQVLFAQHIGRTRYMRCPECGKKSWQKKTL